MSAELETAGHWAPLFDREPSATGTWIELNVGTESEELTSAEVGAALLVWVKGRMIRSYGCRRISATGEPTIAVAGVIDALCHDGLYALHRELDHLSLLLGQAAIAYRVPSLDHEELAGPGAAVWRPFRRELFINLTPWDYRV